MGTIQLAFLSTSTSFPNCFIVVSKTGPVMPYLYNDQNENAFYSSSLLLLIDGKYKAKALLLRGTMYTLMSAIDKAVADFDELLKFEDNEENSKVCLFVKLSYF